MNNPQATSGGPVSSLQRYYVRAGVIFPLSGSRDLFFIFLVRAELSWGQRGAKCGWLATLHREPWTAAGLATFCWSPYRSTPCWTACPTRRWRLWCWERATSGKPVRGGMEGGLYRLNCEIRIQMNAGSFARELKMIWGVVGNYSGKTVAGISWILTWRLWTILHGPF